MSKELVQARQVSKIFCRNLQRSLRYGAIDVFRELAGKARSAELRSHEFWALRDIEFGLRRGECLGLIGHNGAGKSTLLRILHGLIQPSTGTVTIRGRMGALIELGMGFNPILTGRENVLVNAAVLGIPRNIIEREFDNIVDFSGLQDFIDTPVQSYSSGMKVRLGFAIASAMDPDVLLLDEILAVGDIAFRAKCYQRIGELIRNAAVVIVSHDLQNVLRICDRVILLDRGKIVFDGDPYAGVNIYTSQADQQFQPVGTLEVWSTELTVHSLSLSQTKIETGESIDVIITYESTADLEVGLLRCNFKSSSGVLAADYDSQAYGHQYEIRRGKHSLTVRLGPLPLSTGRYVMNLAVYDMTRKTSLLHAADYLTIDVRGKLNGGAICELPIGT